MAYSVLARRLLISCPGDVPDSDLHLVQQAINRWNGIYGEQFGAAIIPISWGTHAAAEFGDAPQELLNKQLVDRCDICLALFANRLGTPTASADSGTAEEIERLSESGRYVGILRSRRAVDGSQIDPDQLKRLNEYLAIIRTRALVLDYASDADLMQRVDTILAAAVSRDQGRAELRLQQAAARQAEVWPRVEARESVIRFGSDRTLPKRDWYLVLANTGDGPARDVKASLTASDGSDFDGILAGDGSDRDAHIEILAPHGEVRFGLVLFAETPPQVNCAVSWSDERGRQENMATLRLVLRSRRCEESEKTRKKPSRNWCRNHSLSTQNTDPKRARNRRSVIIGTNYNVLACHATRPSGALTKLNLLRPTGSRSMM